MKKLLTTVSILGAFGLGLLVNTREIQEVVYASDATSSVAPVIEVENLETDSETDLEKETVEVEIEVAEIIENEEYVYELIQEEVADLDYSIDEGLEVEVEESIEEDTVITNDNVEVHESQIEVEIKPEQEVEVEVYEPQIDNEVDSEVEIEIPTVEEEVTPEVEVEVYEPCTLYRWQMHNMVVENLMRWYGQYSPSWGTGCYNADMLRAINNFMSMEFSGLSEWANFSSNLNAFGNALRSGLCRDELMLFFNAVVGATVPR